MSLHGTTDFAEHLSISCPAAAAVPSGPYTVATLFQNLPGKDSEIWRAYDAGGFSQVNLYFDGNMWNGFKEWAGALDISAAKWWWMVCSKIDGTATPEIHIAEYTSSGAMSWTHSIMNGTRDTYANATRFSIGDEFANGMEGDMALLAAWTTRLSNAEVEAIFTRNSADILAASPQFFVHFPLAAGLDDPFVDLAGGGVETIRSGPWTMSADPPSFDFSLGRSGKPNVWDGTSWNAHNAKVWDGSSWTSHPMAGYDGSQFVLAKGDGGSGPSTIRHTLFADPTPPGTAPTLFSDGLPFIKLAHTYYFSDNTGDPSKYKITGGRVYTPAAFAGLPSGPTYGIRIMAWAPTTGVRDGSGGTPSIADPPDRSVLVTPIVDGWTEASWEPLDLPPFGCRWAIGYQFEDVSTGDVLAYYLHSPDEHPSSPSVPAADGASFVWSEFSDTGSTFGPIYSTMFQIGTGAPANPSAGEGGYAIDTIITETV